METHNTHVSSAGNDSFSLPCTPCPTYIRCGMLENYGMIFPTTSYYVKHYLPPLLSNKNIVEDSPEFRTGECLGSGEGDKIEAPCRPGPKLEAKAALRLTGLKRVHTWWVLLGACPQTQHAGPARGANEQTCSWPRW